MDKCRKCRVEYDDDAVVSIDFSIGGSASHNWYMCSSCADKLEEVVLKWMRRYEEVGFTCQEMSFIDGQLRVDGCKLKK